MWNAYYIWLKRKFTKKEVYYSTTIPEVTSLSEMYNVYGITYE